MRTIEYRTQDKTKWGDGPWQIEPDKVQYADPWTGLPCLVRRSEGSGALCGYVGVPRSHPLYGKRYMDGSAVADLDVHGGITFAAKCAPGDEPTAICHVVEPGEDDDVWWLGFDCAHAFDQMPKMAADGLHLVTRGEYRDLAYVKQEIHKLAAQLARMSVDAPSVDAPSADAPSASVQES